MNHIHIAFIGAGNMGSSLIGGLIADGYDPKKIWATDPSQEKLDALKNHFAIHTTTDNLTAVAKAEAIILAVKPQIMSHVAKEITTVLHNKHPLVISIAAGISIPSLEKWLGAQTAIVRCMPNTPAVVRCGATGLYANHNVTEAQKGIAESILRAVGIALWVDNEKMLDSITALSGSGPAYFFLMMEAMQQAGIQLGLPEDMARLLTIQTGLGAARMALESSHSLSTLCKQVTSPGGTTEAALQVLENAAIRQIFIDALHAAKNRSEELAQHGS